MVPQGNLHAARIATQTIRLDVEQDTGGEYLWPDGKFPA
jgi:hypothetical protein